MQADRNRDGQREAASGGRKRQINAGESKDRNKRLRGDRNEEEDVQMETVMTEMKTKEHGDCRHTRSGGILQQMEENDKKKASERMN